MSAIIYPSLPSEVPTLETPQTANRTSWRNWKFLKPQEEVLMKLTKMVWFLFSGFLIAKMFGETNFENPALHMERVYAHHVTCEQVAAAFVTTGVSILFCSIGVFGLFSEIESRKM